MAKLTGISPVLLVADLDRAVAYDHDRLGFECQVFGDPPNFATADRDAATILLAATDDPDRIVPYEALTSTTRSTTRRTGFVSSEFKTRTATTSHSASR